MPAAVGKSVAYTDNSSASHAGLIDSVNSDGSATIFWWRSDNNNKQIAHNVNEGSGANTWAEPA